MITELISRYNNYMNIVFSNNEFLVGLVTTAILGYFAYIGKAMPSLFYNFLLKHGTTVTYIDSSQESYFNLMDKINELGIINNSRFLSIQNGIWGFGKPVLQLGNGSQLLWFNNRICLIGIQVEKLDQKVLHKLTIRTIGRSHNTANKMLEYCKVKEKNDKIAIINLKNDTKKYQQKEYIRHRILSKEEQELFNDIKNFTENKDWYTEKNIPYKKGFILAGPPGTGKTSSVRAIASELNYDICILDSFSEFAKIPTDRKCIVLIDELDAVVSKRKDTSEGSISTDGIMSSFSEYTVSAALKAMDGAVTMDGTIIIGTTNFPDKIDSALKRHGRFGKTINFTYATEDTFIATVKKYYDVDIKLEGKILKQCSAADLQGKFCEQVPLQEYISYFTE